MTHYTRSNGQTVELSTMAFPHLRSAFQKMEREDPGHPELPGLRVEMLARNIQYRDELVTERASAEPDRQAEIDTAIATVDESIETLREVIEAPE